MSDVIDAQAKKIVQLEADLAMMTARRDACEKVWKEAFMHAVNLHSEKMQELRKQLDALKRDSISEEETP
jgi:hypothetical protein